MLSSGVVGGTVKKHLAWSSACALSAPGLYRARFQAARRGCEEALLRGGPQPLAARRASANPGRDLLGVCLSPASAPRPALAVRRVLQLPVARCGQSSASLCRPSAASARARPLQGGSYACGILIDSSNFQQGKLGISPGLVLQASAVGLLLLLAPRTLLHRQPGEGKAARRARLRQPPRAGAMLPIPTPPPRGEASVLPARKSRAECQHGWGAHWRQARRKSCVTPHANRPHSQGPYSRCHR